MADGNNRGENPLQEHLAGVDYPASKQELLEHARQHNAPGDVISALSRLPERRFSGPNEVSQAVSAIG